MKARRTTIGFAAATCALTLAATAWADEPTTEKALTFRLNPGVLVPHQKEDGFGGRLNPVNPKYAGPGAEQGTVAFNEKLNMLALVYMRSVEGSKQYTGYYQCVGTFIKLNEAAPPSVVDSLVLTNNGGTRGCNHPTLVAYTSPSGQDLFAFAYGTNMQVPGSDSNRTATYLEFLKPPSDGVPAAVVGSRTMVSIPENKLNNTANDGAAHLIVQGNALRVGILSTGGNDNYAYHRALTPKEANGRWTVDMAPIGLEDSEDKKKEWMFSSGNIARPSLVTLPDGRAIAVASKGQGNERPPRYGVEYALIAGGANPAEQKIVTTGLAVKANIIGNKDLNNAYYNQPQASYFGADPTNPAWHLVAVNVIKSNGMGKNTNRKGNNAAELVMLRIKENNQVEVLSKTPVGDRPNQTHSTICAGKWGPNEEQAVVFIGAPITGVGRATATVFRYDMDTQSFVVRDAARDSFAITWTGDSGYLANMYGENPQNQGRDYIRCLADVPNPGYQKEGGWMKDAKTMFIATVAGRDAGEKGTPKNNMQVAFIPAIAPDGLAANPLPVAEVGKDNAAVEVGTTGETTTPTAANNADTEEKGCSVARASGSPVSGLALAGLATALTALARRRRKL